MRRYARILTFIVLLVTLAGASLGFQNIAIGGFERGSDAVLGLSLGLDLQGGIHLVYEADLKDENGLRIPPSPDQMQGLLRTIERRINSGGLGEPIVQILGDDRLLVQLPGVSDPGRAKSLIGETARLEFKHRTLAVPRDLQGLTDAFVSARLGTLAQPAEGQLGPLFRPGTSTVALELLPGQFEPITTTLPSITDFLATTTQRSADSLLGATSTATSTAAAFTPSALLVEFEPGVVAEFEALIARMLDSLAASAGATTVYPDILTVGLKGEAAQLTNIPVLPLLALPDGTIFPAGSEPLIQRVGDTNQFIIDLSATYPDYESALLEFGESPTLVFGEVLGVLDEDIGLTGDDLARAYPGQHQTTGLPIINIEFDSEGTRKFAEITTTIAGTPEQITILLDGEELISPVVNQPITGGVAFIEGRDFTFERVQDIALLLEGGRLPVPIALIQERDIDAILGADSLAKSVVAGLVGTALVLLFMVLYYRVAGVVAAVALVVYATLVLSVFKLLPITLTLSGVAAAILSVGMAVDANILIFERMKEELRAGRTLLSSINIGFNRAWPAIRDSNVSTLITCAILFWFADTLGATIVQGFAATLALGVGISMFSAITVSRTMLRMLAVSPLNKRLGLFVPSGAADLLQRQSPAATG